MFGRLTIGVLVLAGLLLVAVGVQRWLEHRRATECVTAFLTALKQGNRAAALDLLTPEQRRVAEQRAATDSWLPDPGLRFRIHHLKLSGETATAGLWIEKNGYVAQPTVTLVRSATGQWKVNVGRLWEDLQSAEAQSEGERLAHDLSQALDGKRGIVVRRVMLTAEPR